MSTHQKQQRLSGSQDLLTYYDLLPIYNKVVKPYPPENRASGLNPTLFPYISDLPGKLEFEPDGYLVGLIQDPQAIDNGPDIRPLDSDILRDSFSLREGPIPGFDASVLGTDEPMGEEDTSEKAAMDDHDPERRHKKKKKKRHDHEDGHGHDHSKKKKKKREEFIDI
ncbi:hypothetical protein RMATCC62417_04445 [Rhizopus microsporus]|nr:hypothetical protein RMATCC62417_04445 [Rhizopus microsporus]